ncbi:MAG TPA: long-chain fatty acid--CoA ligase [Azospirillum sp.]|nr:long-chain fatty acid--CoA ligase [Azospirillum sp.]
MNGADYLDWPVYGLRQREKEQRLLPELTRLTAHHRERCPEYARVLAALGAPSIYRTVEEVPFLPVSLFKTHRMASVSSDAVFKTVTSSGTTGQAASQILLDRDTAQLQTRALARIMADLLGPERLPMIVVDTNSVIRNRLSFNARAAGVLGMMTFGRSHLFCLDDHMDLDVAGLRAFLERHAGRRILLFGFTFMVWKHFAPAVAEAGLCLHDAILVHSGGWKKLAEEAVDETAFKRRVGEMTGIREIRNFYGMAEQVGSVYVEGEDGLLYPPAFADVIVRDPVTLAPLPPNEVGVVQVLSLLPRSYPGHSLLTEDLGVVEHVDRGAPFRCGKGFRIIGRVPRSELRGCSDVYAAGRGP